MRLTVADIEQAAEAIAAADVLLLQLEVPISASQRAAEIAKSNGASVVLNPAPAQELPDDFLAQVDILTPNEVETESLSGVKVSTETDAERARQSAVGQRAFCCDFDARRARVAIADLRFDTNRFQRTPSRWSIRLRRGMHFAARSQRGLHEANILRLRLLLPMLRVH